MILFSENVLHGRVSVQTWGVLSTRMALLRQSFLVPTRPPFGTGGCAPRPPCLAADRLPKGFLPFRTPTSDLPESEQLHGRTDVEPEGTESVAGTEQAVGRSAGRRRGVGASGSEPKTGTETSGSIPRGGCVCPGSWEQRTSADSQGETGGESPGGGVGERQIRGVQSHPPDRGVG